MNRIAFLAVTPLLASLARTQATSHVVLPPNASHAEQNASSFWFLSPFASRHQLLIHADELKGAVGKRLVGIEVRRTVGSNERLSSGVLNVAVSVGAGVEPIRASGVFSQNHRAPLTRVLMRPIYVASAPSSARQPAEWKSPYSFKLSFSRPYNYAGGPLLVETSTWRVSLGRLLLKAPWWPIDAKRRMDLGGSVRSIGTSCIPEMPEAASADAASLQLGASSVHTLFGRTTAYKIALFGVGFQETKISLDSLGAPGCTARPGELLRAGEL